MDIYVSALEAHVAPGYEVQRTSTEERPKFPKNVICIDVDALDDCASVTELDNMLNKRLGTATRSRSGVGLKAVAMACLASRAYAVNHESLLGTSEKDMQKVWSTLERAKVSSSHALRSWVASRLSFRTCKGYSLALGCVTRSLASPSKTTTPLVPTGPGPVLLDARRVQSAVGVPGTLKGAMLVNAKLLAGIRDYHGLSSPRFLEDL